LLGTCAGYKGAAGGRFVTDISEAGLLTAQAARVKKEVLLNDVPLSMVLKHNRSGTSDSSAVKLDLESGSISVNEEKQVVCSQGRVATLSNSLKNLYDYVPVPVVYGDADYNPYLLFAYLKSRKWIPNKTVNGELPTLTGFMSRYLENKDAVIRYLQDNFDGFTGSISGDLLTFLKWYHKNLVELKPYLDTVFRKAEWSIEQILKDFSEIEDKALGAHWSPGTFREFLAMMRTYRNLDRDSTKIGGGGVGSHNAELARKVLAAKHVMLSRGSDPDVKVWYLGVGCSVMPYLFSDLDGSTDGNVFEVDEACPLKGFIPRDFFNATSELTGTYVLGDAKLPRANKNSHVMTGARYWDNEIAPTDKLDDMGLTLPFLVHAVKHGVSRYAGKIYIDIGSPFFSKFVNACQGYRVLFSCGGRNSSMEMFVTLIRDETVTWSVTGMQAYVRMLLMRVFVKANFQRLKNEMGLQVLPFSPDLWTRVWYMNGKKVQSEKMTIEKLHRIQCNLNKRVTEEQLEYVELIENSAEEPASSSQAEETPDAPAGDEAQDDTGTDY
jgi:hypothetical protein